VSDSDRNLRSSFPILNEDLDLCPIAGDAVWDHSAAIRAGLRNLIEWTSITFSRR
jgi:hypothetical protein